MTKKTKKHHITKKTEEKCCEKQCCRREKETVVACEAPCKCETVCETVETCKCGHDCQCHSKSAGKGFARCLTVIASSVLISASILFVGLEMTKPQIAPRASGSLDIEIGNYLRKNAAFVSQIIAEQEAKIQAAKAAEAERIRLEEEKKQAEALKTYVDKLTKDSNYYSLGNKDGKYVIVEFFDYRCGWCKKTNSALWAEIDGGKAPNIRWIPVDAPIFGEGSALISRYVLAAGKQGKYSEMHHAVATATGNLDKVALDELANKIGLNMEQLTKDVDSEAIKKQIENNMKMAQEIGVQGVPFMIVNGRPHGGALLNEALAQAVKESNEMK